MRKHSMNILFTEGNDTDLRSGDHLDVSIRKIKIRIKAG